MTILFSNKVASFCVACGISKVYVSMYFEKFGVKQLEFMENRVPDSRVRFISQGIRTIERWPLPSSTSASRYRPRVLDWRELAPFIAFSHFVLDKTL